MQTTDSNWREFRFKTPREVFKILRRAMLERDLQILPHRIVNDSDRPEGNFTNDITPFDVKWFWEDGGWEKSVIQFLKERIFQIASYYCDPDKAYDFENYPELENWTAESLEDKLKGDFVHFSPFCSKEKYLVFLFRVLNLCCVRRVLCRSDACYQREAYGWSSSGEGEEYLKNSYNNAVSQIKTTQWMPSYYPESSIVFQAYGQILRQRRALFATWINEKRACDITFFACALDTFDRFSTFGAKDFYGNTITPSKWFCVGVPDEKLTPQSHTLAAKALAFDDSEIPPYPGADFKIGFSVKPIPDEQWHTGTGYGVAVRDYRKYYQYIFQ